MFRGLKVNALNLMQPCNHYLVISSRNDSSSTFTNPVDHSTGPSDTLIVHSINRSNGALAVVQTSPAGGSFPRQFSFSKDGSMIAVGLQMSSRVVVFPMDTSSGRIGNALAVATVPGQVTSIVWDERLS